jgi:arabinofuranosyltransferase
MGFALAPAGALPQILPPTTRVHLAASLAAVACAVAVFWTTARSYLPFIADDALISLRYSERLLSGHGLTFTDGPPVEGYSNLLWVVAVAAGGLVHPELVDVARALSLAAVVTAFAACVWLGVRAGMAWGAVAALGGLALSQGLAIWAIGGLEQPLQVGLLTWALALAVESDDGSRKRTWMAGAGFALLVWTRPDGLLFAAMAALALVVARGGSWASIMAVRPLIVAPAAAWLAQLAFRLAYYGDWWPNTAYVKLAWATNRLYEGSRYVAWGAVWHAPLVVLALAVLLTTRGWRRASWLVPVAAAVGWSAYVSVIGGDIFPGRRHFLPLLACAAVAMAAGWRHSLLARLPTLAQAALIAAALAPYAWIQGRDPANRLARLEVWEWDCGRLAGTLRTAYASTAPLIAADSVGCIGYFGKLPTLDMLGLTDRHIARARPATFGKGYLGHELGDGRYVLSQRPEFVLLCGPVGSATGCFRGGKELVALEEFQRHYVLATIEPEHASYPSLLWVRIDSPALGAEATADRVRLPGLLFATGGARAVLSDGRLVARVAPGATVRLDRLPPGLGGWHARAEASSPMTVHVEGGAIVATAGPAGALLAEIVLTRSGA